MPAELLETSNFAWVADLAAEWHLDPRANAEIVAKLLAPGWITRVLSLPPKPDAQMRVFTARGGKNIAEVQITGVMAKSKSWFADTSTVKVREDITAAANDPSIHGIMLSIDSPGGAVAGTSDLGETIREANGIKPVYTFVEGMAASAAYWAASQSRAIYAGSGMSQVGSIGTYASLYDFSKALEGAGIKAHVFSTSPLKGIGIPGAPVSAEQSAHLQDRVEQLQTFFDEAVRKGRSMSAEELKSVRTGATWFAKDATKNRLINGIKTKDQVVSALAGAA